MKKGDPRSRPTGSGSSSRASGSKSPLRDKRSLPLDAPNLQSQSSGGSHTSHTGAEDQGHLTGTSSEDLVLDNGSDVGTDDLDGQGSDSQRTKQAVEVLQQKIQKTKDAIRREQNNKESIVNEYLQMASDKQPTARIKALFEKKNQKSAQAIVQLQRKLEAHQSRLTDVETHGLTGHKQPIEVLRDVGQGINTIVSKPSKLANKLIRNKGFGSADNIAQLSKFYVDLDESKGENDSGGKQGGTLPAGFKYGSDEDERSSLTSGSGLGVHSSPTSHNAALSSSLEPVRAELREVRETQRETCDMLRRIMEDLDEYKAQISAELASLRAHIEESGYRGEGLQEQVNDLTELHQHQMANLKQDLASTEEKLEYRLDERTADLSDLLDNTSTRILRLEQQQQHQQVLSMEMVENATFRTIISKLINVVLAVLAVLLVCVSTVASFLSPFVKNTPRLMVSGCILLVAWLIYQNMTYFQSAAVSLHAFLTWPWS